MHARNLSSRAQSTICSRLVAHGITFSLGLSLLASGCALEVVDEGDLGEDAFGQVEDELNISSNDIWTQLSIPVCWENPTAVPWTRRQWVKAQVAATWEANSQVRFTGWGTCTAASTGVRIRIADEVSNTGTRLGMELNGVPNGVTLNLIMQKPGFGYAELAAKHGLETAIRSTATHEFGHALGFGHEQLRFDNPDWDCISALGGQPGDVWSGAYDKLSIMRTCTVLEAETAMSASDKLGLQAFYGNPSPAGLRKDVIKWDSESIYFLFGGNYTRYSISQNKMANDGFDPALRRPYPAPIKRDWPRWPTTWPWTGGVDAALQYSASKIYMFSGSQYLRWDKYANFVDAGYPRNLPGGWVNWPTTWTLVDAAFRWPGGRLYLFRGSEYIRISSGVTVDANYPKSIRGNWPGLTWSNIDYVTEFNGDGYVYFFKGSYYWKYSLGTNGTPEGVVGFPVPIVGRWKGVTF